MFKKRSLKMTLIFLVLFISLIPLGISAIMSQRTANDNITEEVFRGWTLAYNIIKGHLVDMFKIQEREVDVITSASVFLNPIKHLRDIGWDYHDQQWLEKVKELEQFAGKVRPSIFEETFTIINPDGLVVHASNENNIGLNLADRNYFKKAMAGKTNWDDLFYSDIFLEDVKVLAMPIFSEGTKGEVLGVFVVVMPSSALTKIIHNEISAVSKTADAYLIDEDGLLLTDSIKAGKASNGLIHIETKAVDLLKPVIKNKDSKYLMQEVYKSAQREELLGIGSYVELGGEDIGLIIEIDTAEVFSGLYRLRKVSISFWLIMAVIVTIFTIVFTNRVTNPIISLMDLMGKAEMGDLTVESNIRRSDELGRLGNSFNGMVKGIAHSMKTVFDATLRVNDAAEDITSSTEQMAAGAESQSSSLQELTATMEEVSASIQDVSDNVHETAESSENVAKSMVEMNISIQDIYKNTQMVALEMADVSKIINALGDGIKEATEETKVSEEEIKKTVEITQAGNQQVEKTIAEMDDINQAVDVLAEAINKLGNSASRIGDIIEVIDDIAEQTNLLALNAAIEAARAGEHGKGFAVVAGAIGDLAAKSREATQDIGKLIKGIQSEVNEAIRTTEDGTIKVAQGVDSVQATGIAFHEIQNTVTAVNQTIDKITQKITAAFKQSSEVQTAVEKVTGLVAEVTQTNEKQAASAEDIVKAADKMAELSREVAATSEEQAASSDEVVKAAENISQVTIESSAASEEIAASSEELKNLANSLLEAVKKFKIE